MPLAVDTEMPTNTGAGSAAPAAPFTFSFTNVGGGLVIIFVMFGVGSADTVTINGTPTFGAVPMTLITSKTTSAGGVTGGKIVAYYLLSAPTGPQTFSIDYSVSPGAIAEIEAGAISFTGHDLVNPIKQSSTAASGGSNTNRATASLSGAVAGNISVFGAGAGSDMTGQNYTLSWNKVVDGASSMGNGRSSRTATSGALAESFVISAVDSWATIALEVAAAGGGGGGGGPATVLPPRPVAYGMIGSGISG